MEHIDTLIHAQHLITCEENNRVLENHALAIQAGKIIAILPSEEADANYIATTVKRYDRHAVLPGFINCHTHSAMILFRGLADDLELMDWLNNYIWPAEGKWVGEEMVYEASLLSMAEMIRCGTICYNDMYFYLQATARATEKAGMRGFIGMTVIDVPTAWAKTTDEYFARAREFYDEYKNHALVTPTLAPHSLYTVTESNMLKVKELADELKLKVNIHLQESPSEMALSLDQYNERPLHRLHKMGLVNKDLIAVHMTQINDDDFDILAEHKPNIVNCPESNVKLASGICPVEKLLHLGVNVALGTDGAASNNDLDMISEMRSAAFIGKISTSNPKAVSALKALKMATINGAKALGIDHLTGSLEVGKAADFIAIDLSPIETQPLYHPVSQIVYAASRNQVTDVWVNGKALMQDRQLLTLDENELLHIAHKWGNKIKSSI